MSATSATPAAARERVTKKRVTGQLIQWKGKFGWIKSAEAIDHPEAANRGGRIYLGMEDVEGADPKEMVKGMVSFFVYSDGNGLGAMHCRPAQGGAMMQNGGGAVAGVQKTIVKHKGDAKGMQKGLQKGQQKGLQKGQQKGGIQALPQGNGIKGNGKGKAGGQWVQVLKGSQLVVKNGLQGKGAQQVKGGNAQAAAVATDRPAPPAPDKAERVRILPKRVVGQVVRWSNHIGWVKPAEPIDHPDAQKRKGSLFLHSADVQPGHTVFKGATVNCFVYSDSHGLGAEHCMLAKEQGGAQQQQQPPKLLPKAKAKAQILAKGNGKGQGEKGGKKLTMVEKTKLKRKKGKKSAGEEGAAEKTKASPDLPRERLSELMVSGEVLEWKEKGKFGWLKPTEPVEHEKASRNKGRIYINAKDLLGVETLEPGQKVDFHVYADASGLGAEECLVTDA